jgi:hypothetical protein
MGTSGSFGGSGGKDATDLRDAVADWLDEPDTGNAGDAAADPGQGEGDEGPTTGRPNIDLTPALRVILRSRGGGGDGPSGGGGGGSRQAGGGAGRSSGGASRSVGRVSRATGRAGRLALAYAVGDREALAQAGLNYDELRGLGDPLAVGLAIVEAAFDSQADGTIEDSEERDIVAAVVEWILEVPADTPPTPEDIVRKSIETLIAEVTLTEVSATIRSNGATYEDRRSIERNIRDVAEEYARQVQLTATGPTEAEIAAAIEQGVRDIGRIFGVES